MDPNQPSVLFRMDMRGHSRAADCMDGLVAFPWAIEQMRSTGDVSDFAQKMVAGTRVAFESLQGDDHEGLLFVAAGAQDLLYRYVMELTIVDRYTRAYCSLATRYFFQQLSTFRIRTFFILDNTLREDRFATLLELFELSGIATTTPRRDGTAWSNLSARLRASLDAAGHVAYIEPDAQVNHIDAAKQLASGVTCVATFRNLSPNYPEQTIVNFVAS